jgi:uncharacterized protein
MSRDSLTTTFGDLSLIDDGGSGAPLVVLAHGAGAPLDSPFMETFAGGLADAGLRVWRFNFPYMEQARKAPDKQPKLEQTFTEVLDVARAEDAPALFAGGKSLGGRIASHVGEGLDGLVFLGYPLHPPGRPDRIRDAHLKALDTPMLFVEGTRDPFCPLGTLEKVRKALRAPTDLVVVEDGDHSFKVRKSSGRTTEEALDEVISSVAEWIRARLPK